MSTAGKTPVVDRSGPLAWVVRNGIRKILIDVDGNVRIVNLKVLHGFENGIEGAQFGKGDFAVGGCYQCGRRHGGVQKLAVPEP